MKIYPAIDILGGKCVRLTQGKYNEKTVYADEPYKMAMEWESKGAAYLHLVDLDGAREGRPVNIDVISKIVDSVNIPVQVGGGIRTVEDIKAYMEIGVARVILGTSAVNDRDFLVSAAVKFGSRIVVGIDAKDGLVAIKGWEELSGLNAVDFAKEVEKIGVKTIIYTDISTDGTLLGCNVSAMKEMCEAVNIKVIASGGIGSYEDIKKVAKTEVEGVIVGRALYAGKVELEKAIELANQASIIEPIFNEKGLIPVITQDYKTGIVLMQAYMNKESFEKTKQTGMATYFSRSRSKLWQKGEESGHLQYVKEILTDCDSDCLLLKVEQVDAACHTGNYSCFYRKITGEEIDERLSPTANILQKVYDTISYRKKNPKEGSYTNYLFDKGIDKICKKIGEEACETIIAAKNSSKSEITAEIADLLFHTMVLMSEVDVQPVDIYSELSKRH